MPHAWQIVALALGLTALASEVWLRLARVARFVEQPDARRVHPRATPTSGGVALLGAVLATLWLFELDIRSADWVLLGALAGLGFVDDRRELSPLVLLGGQTIAVMAWLGLAAPATPSLAAYLGV
jgi:UDP-N-acetylmuramyl pentapeptide phosphotransferase/UDP-N-acetylglucosamine-1-phosphate transferase